MREKARLVKQKRELKDIVQTLEDRSKTIKKENNGSFSLGINGAKMN